MKYILTCIPFYVVAFTTFITMPTGSTGITITQGNGYCFLSKLLDLPFVGHFQNNYMEDPGSATIKNAANPKHQEEEELQ